MSRWVWIEQEVILAIHEMQLAEHGGASGLRSVELLQSALARPRHLAAYGSPEVEELAAAYGWGVARNHPFVDGNKRTGLVATELFLSLNERKLRVDDASWVAMMLDVAAGAVEESQFARWLGEHLERQ